MENYNREQDNKDAILSLTLMTTFWVVAASILVYRQLYLLLFGYIAFFLLFPLMFVCMKFGMSDCINKASIIDRGMDDSMVMLFSDERKNMRVSEFIAREMRNANFWMAVASLLMVFLGLTWK